MRIDKFFVLIFTKAENAKPYSDFTVEDEILAEYQQGISEWGSHIIHFNTQNVLTAIRVLMFEDKIDPQHVMLFCEEEEIPLNGKYYTINNFHFKPDYDYMMTRAGYLIVKGLEKKRETKLT